MLLRCLFTRSNVLPSQTPISKVGPKCAESLAYAWIEGINRITAQSVDTIDAQPINFASPGQW